MQIEVEGGLNVMDVRRERIPFPWNTVRERALVKGFCFNMVDTQYLCSFGFSSYFHVCLLAFQPRHSSCRLIMLFTVACMVLVCTGISQCVCLSWTVCNSPGYTKHCVTSPGYTKHYVTSPGYTKHCVMSPGYTKHCVTSPGCTKHCVTSPGYTKLCVTSPGNTKHCMT